MLTNSAKLSAHTIIARIGRNPKITGLITRNMLVSSITPGLGSPTPIFSPVKGDLYGHLFAATAAAIPAGGMACVVCNLVLPHINPLLEQSRNEQNIPHFAPSCHCAYGLRHKAPGYDALG